jgi:hypothetical protein
MMLQRQTDTVCLTGMHRPFSEESFREPATARRLSRAMSRDLRTDAYILAAEENPPPKGEETGLEDAARSERDYLRQRLREELGREPTEQELDEWLRQHTEGY